MFEVIHTVCTVVGLGSATGCSVLYVGILIKDQEQ